jgi:ribosomal protein S27AE
MSHWAELDENNKVIRVLVGDNNDPAGDEGYSWLINNLGGNWIQTSYNGTIRYNYAGIGYIYDVVDDAFIAPMPQCGHDSLLLNNLKRWECETCEAEALKISDPA